MSRLADPTLCPDCRAPLTGFRCPACGLTLQGEDASRLWRLLVEADGLVTRLRTAAGPVAAPPTGPAPRPAPTSVSPSTFGSAPLPPPVPPRRGLSAASVPVVLLALGGLCLVVFAAVFLGQSWDALGLWGRSLVVLGLTAALASTATVVTLRGLRASAETLWVVVGLMLTFDLYAAAAADLVLRDLSGRTTTTVAGLALVVLGAGVATWARGTRCRELATPQLLLVLGVGLLTVAQGLTRGEPAVPAALLAPVLLAGALLWRRLRLPWAAAATLALAVATWLLLAGIGVARATGLDDPDPVGIWWWPLVLGAAYAAAVVLAPQRLLGLERRGEALTRALAAAGTVGPLVVLANAAVLTDSESLRVLLACLTLLVLCAVVVLAGPAWGRGTAPYLVLGAAGAAADTLLAPLTAIGGRLLDPSVSLTPRTRITVEDPTLALSLLVGMVVAVCAATLVGLRGPGLTGLVTGRALDVDDAPSRSALAGSAATGAVALGAWSTVLALEPLLWTATLAGLVAAAATGWGAWAWRQQPVACLVAASATAWIGVVVAAVAVTSGSSLLLAMVLTAFTAPLAVAGAVRDRAGAGLSAASLLALAAGVGAVATGAWADWLGASDRWVGVLLAAYAAVVLLAAGPTTRLAVARLGLEVSTVPIGLAALLLAETPETGTVVLGVLATAAAVSSALASSSSPGVRERAALGWVAATLALGGAAWRLLAGLPLPEAPTLLVGLVLLVPGALRLRTEPGLPSAPALGLGLAVGLLPSLLPALAEPVTLRGLLVGLAAVALLATGVGTRLAAPFVVGSVATGLLVLRHLGPVVESMERWILIGIVGALLLAAGITWEAGLRSLSRARRYVVSLRGGARGSVDTMVR